MRTVTVPAPDGDGEYFLSIKSDILLFIKHIIYNDNDTSKEETDENDKRHV